MFVMLKETPLFQLSTVIFCNAEGTQGAHRMCNLGNLKTLLESICSGRNCTRLMHFTARYPSSPYIFSLTDSYLRWKA